MEEAGGKLIGKVLGEAKVFFVDKVWGAIRLLEGVEACCKDKDGKRHSKVWVENGRVQVGVTRRCIIYLYSFFLRGKDAPNLTDLKASGERGQFNGGGKRLYANSIWKVHGRIGEAVWIQVGIDEVQSRKEQLTCCLVGDGVSVQI
ncbi:hypothetical protein CK203_092568 [Vitis vinifera]|uniref:Uncharacterized protein n=1 Tax=Vitis vinifera TaxID=29760 RepID=A0A438CVF4_VITVI|nr:hypothetical protein CK203_092568 [Vitis vinifera]